MSCKSLTAEYTEIVKNLITSNTKYRNFDNAVALVLSNDVLDAEQKKYAVHYFANIYKGLIDLDSTAYSEGSIQQIIDATPALENTVKYLELVNDVYGLKHVTELTKKSLLADINELKDSPVSISRGDINTLYGKIGRYFDTHTFDTKEDARLENEEIKNHVIDAIDNNGGTKSNVQGSIKKVEEFSSRIITNTNYIDLNTIGELNKEEELLVFLKDGSLVEAVEQEGKSFVYDSNTGVVGDMIPDDFIATTKKLRNEVSKPESLSGGEVSIHALSLLSGFQVRPVDPSELGALHTALNEVSPDSGAITVSAVRLSDIGDRRVAKMHTLATEAPKFSKLANRKHETFENEYQIEKLKNHSDAKIITVRRPNTDDEVVFIGSIAGTDHKFYLYNLDNYTIVDANNNTTAFDFNNPEHITLLKETGLRYDGYSERNKLTNDDISSLTNAYNSFQGFKAEAVKQLELNDHLDITELFNNHYQPGQYNSGKKFKSLRDAVKSDPNLYTTVTVVTNNKGEISDEKEVKLPVNFTKKYNKATKQYDYTFHAILDAKQSIKITNPEGEVAYVNERAYVQNLLGVKEGNENAVLDKLFKTEHTRYNTTGYVTPRFVIKFMSDGTLKYQPTDFVKPAYYGEYFMDFIESLVNVDLTIPKDVKRFEEQRGFRFFNSKAEPGVAHLIVNFATMPGGTELLLEIRSGFTKNPKDFKNYIGGGSKKNYNVSVEFIRTKSKEFIESIKENEVKAVLADYPALSFDETNPFDFYKEVHDLATDKKAKDSVKNLADVISKFSEEVLNDFTDAVVSNLKNNFQKAIDIEAQTSTTTLIDLLKKHYHYDNDGSSLDDFDFSPLVKDVVGGRTGTESHLSIKPVSKVKFESTLQSVLLYSEHAKQFAITPKANTTPVPQQGYANYMAQYPQSDIDAAMSDYEDGMKEEPSTEKKKRVRKSNIKPKGDPNSPTLSVEQGDVNAATQDDIDTESSWLQKALPQFTVTVDDLSDIIDLTSINGQVLGAYKDRVIYLNEAMTGKGTLYHEAFHGVFRNIMDSNGREMLIDLVAGNKANKELFTVDSLKKFAKDRNLVYDEATMRNLQAEEILADGFQNYMLDSTNPKGLLGQFFKMLEKIIKFFSKNDKHIDVVYKKIKDGRYSAAVINSEVFKGEYALEVIPGLKRHYEEDGINIQRKGQLSSKDQNWLINMVVSSVLKDTRKVDFDTKFESAAETLLATYDIEELIDKNPEMEDRIREKWEPMISNFRFMLGARMDVDKYGYTHDINMTSDPENDHWMSKDEVDLGDGKKINNQDGSYSRNLLKAVSKKRLNEILSIEIERDEDSIDDIISGEATEGQEDNDINEEVESGDSGFDSGYGMSDPVNQVKYIRSFLSTIERDEIDEETGITIPRVVDGRYIFPTLLKITAGIDPSSIIPTIKNIANQMKEDGYEDSYLDLIAIYNSINTATELDLADNPLKNKQLYKLFIEVLNVVELDYSMFLLITPEKQDETSLVETTPVNNRHRAIVKDSVLTSDVNDRKNAILGDMLNSFKSKNSVKQQKHYAAVQKLKTLLKTVTSSKENDAIVMGGLNPIAKLDELSGDLHEAMNDIGLKLPKSLIKMSLLAVDIVKNEQGVPLNKDLKDIYDTHKGFIQETKYLEYEFFYDLDKMINEMYSGKIKKPGFVKIMDEEVGLSRDDVFNKDRFVTILKKASEYVLKYDPQAITSVIKNAEGKNIYRYAKYNPLVQISQKIRREGLLNVLKTDPYFEEFLMPFMADSLIVGDLLRGVDNEKTREVKLYLDNLNVSMLGGLQQIIGSTIKEGKAFKTIDEKSMYVLQIMAFVNRTTYSDGDVKITTYRRQFHQLESTQTNFLLNSIYKPFTQNYAQSEIKNKLQREGKATYKDEYLAVVEDLEGAIKQEYNRIARELSTRESRKIAFEKGTDNKLVLKYNAVYDSENKVLISKVNPKTGKETLRAYKFNRLATFWEQKGNTDIADIHQELLSNAAKGIDPKTGEPIVSFEELEDGLKRAMYKELSSYAEKEFGNHILKLREHGIIDVHTETYTNKEGVEIAAPTVYMTSSVIPKDVKTDFSSEPVDSMYPKYKNAPKDTGVYNMVFDAFMNNWSNTLNLNQIFDGDVAMGVKDDIDLVKRYKKFAAAGTNMKEGTHKVAYVNTIEAYTHPDYVTYGPYMSIDQILNDPLVETKELRDELLEGFESGKNRYPIFDGQSISSLMHQMDMFDSSGRLSSRATELMIKKHYTPLTPSEIKELKNLRIVNNSKKTVTAGRYTYHKLSEYYIDRLDVSVFVHPKGENENDDQYDASRKERLKEIHGLYAKIYEARLQSQQAVKDKDFGKVDELAGEIQKYVLDIHSSYKPKMNRVALHELLNSMEFHQIDQMMDTEASKNATLMPIDLFSRPKKGGYHDLSLSSLEVENYLKYLQVETSGVKEKAKVGVQKKLLLPADIASLISKLRTGTLTSLQEKELDVLGAALDSYNNSLTTSSKARLDYVRNVIRKGEDLDIAMLYSIVRKSMEDQGASASAIRMFNIKPNGKPAVNPNMPMVRKMVEYFFFSHYSSNITDEKAAGFKSFHESMWGWDVIVNSDNQVISKDIYDLDPLHYEDNPEFRTRPLSVSIEVDPDTGMKTYWTEAIVPMPDFKNNADRQFYKEKMTKMFATRIPTEDKRSMIAMKVVDFVDSSKLNSVIVPQYIHILSGSDFDIDSLFGQMLATYRNAKGEQMIYGEYDNYNEKPAGEFLEFLHYMSSKSEFKSEIKEARATMVKEGGAVSITEGTPIFDILTKGYGFTMEELIALSEYNDNVERIKFLKDDIKQLYALKEETKADLNNLEKSEIEEKESLIAEMQEYNRIRFDEIDEKNNLGQTLRTSEKIFSVIKTYIPMFEVFSKVGIPVSLEKFTTNADYNSMVAPKFQNENLNASLSILSNKAIFDNLYINEKTSDDMFMEILEGDPTKLVEGTDKERGVGFGLKIEDLTAKGDIHTPDSVIASKIETSSFKDGISIAASLNKFLGLASTYGLELNHEDIIWDFAQTGKEKRVQKYSFDKVNEDGVRAIAVAGGMLGVFADGAKKPIPSALGLNEINTNVALVMSALGLHPNFVMGFNFIPEVKSAIRRVKEVDQAITLELTDQVVYFSQAVEDEIAELLESEANAVYNELILAGLVVNDRKKSLKTFNIDKNNLTIDFKSKNLDLSKVKGDMLSIDDIGYTVKGEKETELTLDAQKVILLKMYANQIKQLFDIRKANSVTAFHKKLNPEIIVFDKVHEHVKWLRSEESIFTSESVGRLFNNTVYNVAEDTFDDVQAQLGNIFLERSESLKGVVELFKPILHDKRIISNTLVGAFSSRVYKQSLLERSSDTDYGKEMISLDNTNLSEVTSPDYLFSSTLMSEIDSFRELYPNNEFLSKLREDSSSGTNALLEGGGLVNEHTIRVMSKLKVKGDISEQIQEDLAFIYNSGRDGKLFIKKLFYAELSRTGGQYREGTYLDLFSNELIEELSEGLDSVLDVLSDDLLTRTEQQEKLTGLFGESFSNVMKDMMVHLSLATIGEVGNRKIKKAQPLKINLSDNPVYNSGLTLAVQQLKGNSKLSVTELRGKIWETIEQVFNLHFENKEQVAKKYVLDPAVLGEAFDINAPKDLQVSGHISRALGIQRTIDKKNNVEFVYPMVYRVGLEYYRLNKVDGDTLTVDSISTHPEHDEDGNKISPINHGVSAEYVKLPKEILDSKSSHLGWSAEGMDRYLELVNHKASIDIKSEIGLDSVLNITAPNSFIREAYRGDDFDTLKFFIKEGKYYRTAPATMYEGGIPGDIRTENISALEYQKEYDKGLRLNDLKIIKPESIKDNDIKGEKVINAQDIIAFKSYMTKSDGVKPKGFFTSSTKFKAFYNNETSKREGAPQSSRWVLQSNGRYDLVDQETGEVFITNVDLETGFQYEYAIKPSTEGKITMPKYTVNREYKNADGSKRLAGTDGVNIILNTVKNVQELFDYMEGKEGPSSEQKAKVLEGLSTQGYGVAKLKEILTTPLLVNTFLVLHEQDHIDHNDKDVYWKHGKDLLTEDKIAIEVRATVNALKKIEGTLPKASVETVRAVEYTPKGKKTQTYTIEGTTILNSKGAKVFEKDSVDRNKIFANLAVKEGTAVVVKYRGTDYVVNNKNVVTSTISGKIMKQETIVAGAIKEADVRRKAEATGNPNNLQKPDQNDINNCIG